MSPDSTPAVWLEPAHSDLKWHSSVSVLKMVFSFRLFLQFSQLCLCFSERLDWFCVSTLKHCVVFNPPVREKLLMKRTSPEHTALYYQTSRDINICGLRLKSSDLFSLVCCFSWFYILNWVSNILMTFREILNHFDITAILKKYLRNVWKTHVPLNASWETSEKHMCVWMHHTWNIWKTRSFERITHDLLFHIIQVCFHREGRRSVELTSVLNEQVFNSSDRPSDDQFLLRRLFTDKESVCRVSYSTWECSLIWSFTPLWNIVWYVSL